MHRTLIGAVFILTLLGAATEARDLSAAAKAINRHMCHYADFSGDSLAYAHQHQLVVAHPDLWAATRAQIQQIQQGANPADPSDDVIVLCYISIGEDLRTTGLTDSQFAADSRFRGNGQGPRVDPRGKGGSGGSLMNLDPMGKPSPGGTGWASYYLDDNSVINGESVGVDRLGWPDRNKIFHGAFVNAGDPAWYSLLKTMRYDSADRVFGMDELLTTTYGRGLGCDGLFLDTVDTAAPNYYTDASAPNESKFEWTAAGFRIFMQRLRNDYPEKFLLQNRGIFFFDPRQQQYQVTTRGLPHFVLFESFRLNSNGGYDSNFYKDNLYNYAPKLMAEANRADGFRVLSLGYIAGTSMSYSTLFGRSTLGYDTMIEDIRVTESVVGMRHYLTSGGVDLANSFVLQHSNSSAWDGTAPVWSSTYNPNSWPPGPPNSLRVGIQKATSNAGYVMVYWDVAFDLNGVQYALYYKTTPFSGANPLAGATRVVMTTNKPADYLATATTYPNQFSVTGLTSGVTYYFLIRAFDNSPQHNEETNTVTLSAKSTGSGSTPTSVPPTPTSAPPPPPPPSGTGSAHNGVVSQIPGSFSAINFDDGGEGVAYHDVEPANLGGQYRLTEGVDIQASSLGGYNIGWMRPGEWVQYTVNIATSGSYAFNMQVAATLSTSTFYLILDGTRGDTWPATGTIPNTGDTQTWGTASVAIWLPGGLHKIRVMTDTGYFNIRLITVATRATNK